MDAGKGTKALALNPFTENHGFVGEESPVPAVVDVESTLIFSQAFLTGASYVTRACWSSTNAALDLTLLTPSACANS